MINCLDKGFVRLVDHMGNDLSIVRAARNSFDAAWRAGVNESNDEKLINYLMKHRHSTPFEVVTFTFEVKAPIFVLRQWHRHRTWTYNEVSARYTELPDEYYIPELENIGVQSKDNKQGRTLEDSLDEGEEIINLIQTSCNYSFYTYTELLNRGTPRELARVVLPLNTYSKMFATVDLWNLLHFLKLRLDTHAQYEIRKYAEAILELIKPVVPVSINAWSTL